MAQDKAEKDAANSNKNLHLSFLIREADFSV